jgi:hypothetical protein
MVPVGALKPLAFFLVLDELSQLGEVECPDTTKFRGAGQVAARRHRLDVTALEPKDQFGCLDCAAFGDGHVAPISDSAIRLIVPPGAQLFIDALAEGVCLEGIEDCYGGSRVLTRGPPQVCKLQCHFVLHFVPENSQVPTVGRGYSRRDQMRDFENAVMREMAPTPPSSWSLNGGGQATPVRNYRHSLSRFWKLNASLKTDHCKTTTFPSVVVPMCTIL